MTRRDLLAAATLISGCSQAPGPDPRPTPGSLASLPWQQFTAAAQGAEVAFAMWAGDEERNRHMRGPVTEALQSSYGIALRVIPLADTAEVINKLLNEKAAGRDPGSVDLLWINGENFRTARQAEILWGPFAGALPNIGLYPESARSLDFGHPIEGFEAPWGRAQFVMGYDAARIPRPPKTLHALLEWARRNPGRFTYVAPPDFTGSAFVRHALFLGAEPGAFSTFEAEIWERASKAAIAFFRRIRPYLWRQGTTYPTGPAELNRLFANREVDFTMSYNPHFAAQRIRRGEFPPSVRTFVWDDGTLGNYSYLAIPFNAARPAAAAVVVNHLLSFEAQLEQITAMPAPFIIDSARLSPEQVQRVKALEHHESVLPDSLLAEKFVAEPHAEYLVRMEKLWIEEVLKQ